MIFIAAVPILLFLVHEVYSRLLKDITLSTDVEGHVTPGNIAKPPPLTACGVLVGGSTCERGSGGGGLCGAVGKRGQLQGGGRDATQIHIHLFRCC